MRSARRVAIGAGATNQAVKAIAIARGYLLETEIDRMNDILPAMKSFILSGGHPAVSTTHVVRCVCRRAERICVHMQEEKLLIEPLVIIYLNRLSDYLFVLARYIGHLLNVPEVPWKPRVSG